MGRALEELEAPAAAERKKESAVRAGKARQGNSDVKILPDAEKGRTREIIGKAIGLSGPTYQRAKAVIAALKHPNGAKKSDRQIAEHVGVSHATVIKYRERLEASGQVDQIETRTVTRGGTTYEQDTTNIGRKPEPVEVDGAASGSIALLHPRLHLSAGWGKMGGVKAELPTLWANSSAGLRIRAKQ